MMQLRARRSSSDAAQRDRREARLEPVQVSPQDGGRGGVQLPGRQEPLLQADAPAQCGVMRAAATHTPSQTSSPRVAVLLGGLQTALCSSLRIGHADGDEESSRKIQQMIKRTIKTTGLRNSVIVGTKELDKSTKYAEMVIDILCSFSYIKCYKVFKPLSMK